MERRYRPALDGLRAIAVLTVLVSHSWGAVLPGGWVGVDIFFVLSGYLITSILVAERGRRGRFSLSRFYWRRMPRLFPAPAATLALAALFAPFPPPSPPT